jgi:hypothetical protein
MNLLLQLSWLAAGAILGLVIGVPLGLSRSQARNQRTRLVMADSQQRRLLDKLREQNQELMNQIEASAERQARAMDALRQSHASEKAALESQVSEQHDKMRKMAAAFSDGHVISGTSFGPTQFDESA